ncbi:MAG: HAMP domain-containing protein [Thermoleophilales bacterium]|nr:HAMP domain-containing protein [Thermoleophilales bacterium]
MTLRRTLLLAVSYVLLLAVVAFGVPLAVSLRDRVDAEVRGQARSQADLLAASASELLSPSDRSALGRLVDSSAESVRGRVIVVNASGKVLSDSAGPGEVGSDFSTRPEIEAATNGSTYQEQRYSQTLSTDILATAVPVLERGLPVGAVRVTQSVDAVNGAVHRSIAGIAVLGACVLALGLIAGALIAQRIAKPIGRLADAANDVAAGDLDVRAPVEGTVEQRKLARSFNEMTARVGRMLQGQRDFVADSSHQLRTPLTGLRLQVEEIRHEATGAEARMAADAALREVDRLTAMVNELLVLSRAGEHELPAEDVDLTETADRLVSRWRRAAGERRISLRRSSDGRGRTVGCAPADLDRALDALAENAILYSPQGGEVEIHDDAESIAILDRGPGFEEGEREAVLERFYRGSAGRRGPQGTGLGLPIAAELAGQWGGVLTLQDRRGGGAQARISFPEASARGKRDR